jgi:hypothetical protein
MLGLCADVADAEAMGKVRDRIEVSQRSAHEPFHSSTHSLVHSLVVFVLATRHLTLSLARPIAAFE